MPSIFRPLRAYSWSPFGANQSRPSQSVMALRASASVSAKGRTPFGLISRWLPVSVTTGEAQ
jgi:hypothetical protein